jgi:hypothetical protein
MRGDQTPDSLRQFRKKFIWIPTRRDGFLREKTQVKAGQTDRGRQRPNVHPHNASPLAVQVQKGRFAAARHMPDRSFHDPSFGDQLL